MRKIFGSFDKADIAKNYLESTKNVADAAFYLIQYKRDGYWEDVDVDDNVKIFRLDKKYPGNTGKLNDWFNIIERVGVGDNEWCIFTDIHDVVFQTDIPELPKEKNALVCYEGKKFGDIGFWRNVLPTEMHNKKAYNCGVFAMKGKYFLKYLQMVHDKYEYIKKWKKDFTAISLGFGFPFTSQYCTDMITATVGSMFNGVADTLIFNEYIQKITDCFEWNDACCYNFSLENYTAIIYRGKLCDPFGTPFSIAHYNGKIEGRIK